MRILLIGSGGQLGRSFMSNEHLAAHQIEITDFPQTDIRDKLAVSRLITDDHYDAVINCAAFTNVDLCESKREEAYSVNVEGVRNIAEAASEAGSILVHLSTDFVFDGKKGSPYSEDDEPSPLNYYGETKLKSEIIVRSIIDRHFIVRTSSLYSKYGSNFVKAILKRARNSDFINVVSDQVSSPTFADDLVNSVLSLIETDRFGTYHVTNSGYCSKYEFAKYIVSRCSINCKVEPIGSEEYKSKAVRPEFSSLSTCKIEQLLGRKQPDWKESADIFLKRDADFI